MHSCLSGVSAAKYASYRLALLLEETDNDLVSVLAAAASFLAEGTEKISTAQASILLGHLVSYSAVRNSTTHVNTSVLVAQVLAIPLTFTHIQTDAPLRYSYHSTGLIGSAWSAWCECAGRNVGARSRRAQSLVSVTHSSYPYRL